MDSISKSSYTTKVGPNDVLLGRGDHSVKNEGNIRFRQLVKTQKARYKNVADVSEKHDIACEIIRAVRDRGGQFLRRVEPLGEAQELGVLSEEEAWVPAEESIVIKKCKQAFRDKPPKKENTGAAGLGHGEGSPRRNAPQQDTINAMHTSFAQLFQLQQPTRINGSGLQHDDELARGLLANIPRSAQHMDLNEQLAQIFRSSPSASSAQHQQLSNFLMVEAAMAAELQRRQLAEQALASLTRQPQRSSQEPYVHNLILQLQQRQASALASLSGPSSNNQASIAQILRLQQNPPQNEWLSRALAILPGGARSAPALSGSFNSSNALAAALQENPSRRLQEALARRNNSLLLQETQRQRELAGLQALQLLQRLQQQQQQPSLDTSTLTPASSELDILRALVALQQQQQQQQQTMRPDAESTVALGASSPPVPFSPFARKRDNQQSRRDESPLSEKEFPNTDDSAPQKRFKTEPKSDSSSLSQDSSVRSAKKNSLEQKLNTS